MKARIRALVRATPAPVALPALSAVGRADWLRPGHRAAAQEHMRLLLRDTPREGEASALARARMRHRRGLEELVWRPQLSARAPIDGVEVLRALRAAGNGVVVAHVHLCLMSPPLYALSAQGHADALVIAVDDPPTALDRHYDRVFRGFGVKLIAVGGAYGPALRCLERGLVCHIALDVPGREACEFLGKPAGLAGGAGALAFASGAPVVPVFPRLRRSRIVLRVGEPLHPREFADGAAVTGHLAALASREILAVPELYHDHEWLQRIWARPR